jgi:hypothetical protein
VENQKRSWRRRRGLFRFDPDTTRYAGPESILDGGIDAPMERRDLLFVVVVIVTVFAASAAIALLAIMLGFA